MDKKIISTEKAPAAVGAYVQAIRKGNVPIHGAVQEQTFTGRKN